MNTFWGTFFAHFVVALFPVGIFVIPLSILVCMDDGSSNVKNSDSRVAAIAIVFTIIASSIVSYAFTSSSMRDLSSRVLDITNNKNYIELSVPVYRKVDVDKNEKYIVVSGNINASDVETDYTECGIKDFLGGGNAVQVHKFYYSKYFEMLSKYADNLGGYLKYSKNKKFYALDSMLLSSDVEFDSREELDKELERKWDKYNKETGNDSQSYRKKDQEYIGSRSWYSYELKIPEKYYNMLNNFEEASLIEDSFEFSPSSFLKRALERGSSKEDYGKRPFLSIFYLYNLSEELGI